MDLSCTFGQSANKTAAIVTSTAPKDCEYNYESASSPVFSFPPEMQPTPRCVQDLTGIVKGRVVVIGYSHSRKRKNDIVHLWVCKCKCGNYLLLKGKTIRKQTEGETACQECNSLQNKKYVARSVYGYRGLKVENGLSKRLPSQIKDGHVVKVAS